MEERIFSKQDLKGGKPISLMCLAKIECILLNLPATEAIAERCFSALKRLLNDYNGSMKKELFIAMCKIKMVVRYKRKYY